MARTIYSRASLVILDDCFVGLDGRTESFILDKIFGPDGVLNARTTILATSSRKLVEILLITQTKILPAKYLALANHIITIDANCNVVREGPYLDAALTINQIEQPESQHQRIAPMSLEDDDAELIRAASDANDTNKPASSEWAVYQWYFRAAGSLNFMVFLVLCSFFVVGVIYPRKMHQIRSRLKKQSLINLVHRGFSSKLDGKDPSRPEVNTSDLLWSIFRCRLYGLDRFRRCLRLFVLTDGGPSGSFLPYNASRHNAQVGLTLLFYGVVANHSIVHRWSSSPRLIVDALSTGTCQASVWWV